MCSGRRNRALRSQQLNRMNGMNGPLLGGVGPLASHREAGIGALINAVNNMSVKSGTMPPQYVGQTPTYPADQKEAYPSEAPPTYDAASADVSPQVATREMTDSTYVTVGSRQQVPQELELPPHYQATSPKISKNIELLKSAAVAYQVGSMRPRHIRKAIRSLRNELYEEEIARREAMYGRLRCGERCEIWREIKAIDFRY